MLHSGAHRVLHRAAIEPGDRLKLVERDHDLPAARLGKSRRQREHLLREPGDIPLCPDVGKRDRQITQRRVAGRISDFGARGADRLAQPAPRAIPFRFRRDERARVAFEEGHIGAEAADGDVDRERAAAGDRDERAADERRLPVAAWRDQEDLLAAGEIRDQPIELGNPVYEGWRGDDLAVDERVIHYVTLRNGYGL